MLERTLKEHRRRPREKNLFHMKGRLPTQHLMPTSHYPSLWEMNRFNKAAIRHSIQVQHQTHDTDELHSGVGAAQGF